MQPTYDYRKFAILYVDDEEKSLKYFARAYGDQFRILTALNAQEGLKLLEEHKDSLGILMTDQRMPGEKGVWLLERARQINPRIVRILCTAFADMDAAIAAVNTGSIYKYITKPWDPPQLESTLKRALEFFLVQRERDQLLKEKMSVLHNLMVADRILSLGLLAAGLSHHIRNSLVAVKTFLDLAPSKLGEGTIDAMSSRDPEFWRDCYQQTQRQIDKITGMLHDLWQASEPQPLAFTDAVRLHEEIAAAAAPLKSSFAEKNIRLELAVPASLPAMKVDRPKFQRLFELLLRDELVSLPAGSVVTISATPAEGQPADRPALQVRVSDNGPGLPREALRLVFDPFVVRADTPAEYGINLMAVYFIVYHHGGRIEAQSDANGTTFLLTLPCNPEQAPRPEEERQFLQKVLLNEQIWEKLSTAA
jgi:two-component system probable response regulator PhcQ